MRPLRSLVVAAVAVATVGCVTRADLAHRDQQILRYMREQRRQIESVQREVERLRGEVDGGGRPVGVPPGVLEERVTALERHVYQGAVGLPVDPAADPMPLPPEAPPGDQTGVVPPMPPQPVETGLMAAWAGDVQAEIDGASRSDAPGRDAYVEALQGVAARDCGPAVSKLDEFARSHRDSGLADNALYWAARCYVLMGDATPGRSTEFYNQAISKFYDVGTSYPKGEKTPAALLEQGDLFIRIGDVPDARIVFSRLIRDYPTSKEAAAARQKLVDLGG